MWSSCFRPITSDKEVFEEVKNAARSLTTMVSMIRTGAWHAPDEALRDPREK